MDRKLQFKIFIRSLFVQVGWNFRGMQNIGFLFGIFPALEKFYKHENLNRAALRHIQYFNTNPYMAGFTLGLCAKMEEKVSRLSNCNEEIEKIKSLKNALSTATAAIGDRFFWSVLKPFSLALTLFIIVALDVNFINLTVGGSVKDISIIAAGLIGGFLFYNFMALYIRWNSIAYGYNCAEDKYCGINFIDWNKLIRKLKLFGLILILSGVIIFLVKCMLFVFAFQSDFILSV